jgi:sulfatase maturation enzyme AslB (radical SAM superfamily)
MERSTAVRERYPLPDAVASYGTSEQFDRARKESGQWVFWEDRVALVLEGRYEEVKPLHVELSPTYLCNFACPWCSCRSAREEWSEQDVFHHPRATPLTVMRQPLLETVIARLAEERIGIMWVGGEPSMNPLIYPAMKMGHDHGLAQCLFTNGSLLDEDRVRTCFEAELVFVRVSLDAVTDSVHQAHHDYDEQHGYAGRVRRNVDTLARLRSEGRSNTMVGISVVVDKCNVGDLLCVARFLNDVARRHGKRCIDYTIVRPAYPFSGSRVEGSAGLAERVLDTVAEGSEFRALLDEAGIRLVVPEASVPQPEAAPAESQGERCLSCGWFGEVTPSGDVVVCSDLYGSPEHFVGNLRSETVDSIWRGERRRRVLQLVEERSCFKTTCPRNGRGYYLNRVFHSVERFRNEGRMAEVKHWIEDLREVLPRPAHSFFL